MKHWSALIDKVGHLLALRVTPADVFHFAEAIPDATGESVTPVYVDPGSTGAGDAARSQGIERHVVKLRAAKRGFVLLPNRRVVERSFVVIIMCGVSSKTANEMPQFLPTCIS